MKYKPYSQPHIAELSEKLQKDVDAILEDFLTYIKDESPRESFQTHINVDMVLKTKLQKREAHQAHTAHMRTKHTYQRPQHIDSRMNPIHFVPHSDRAVRKKGFVLESLAQFLLKL